MKKFFTSTIFILAFGAYAVNQYLGASTVSTEVAVNTTPTTTSGDSFASNQTTSDTNQTAPPTPAPTPVPTPNPTPTPPKSKGQYVDGTYTGISANAYYGYVQVQATVSDGKLTSVSFLSYPNDRNTSREINSQAMPLLKQEAIAAQSANVSGVSGASDTSMAFRESLASALSQAKS